MALPIGYMDVKGLVKIDVNMLNYLGTAKYTVPYAPSPIKRTGFRGNA